MAENKTKFKVELVNGSVHFVNADSYRIEDGVLTFMTRPTRAGYSKVVREYSLVNIIYWEEV